MTTTKHSAVDNAAENCDKTKDEEDYTENPKKIKKNCDIEYFYGTCVSWEMFLLIKRQNHMFICLQYFVERRDCVLLKIYYFFTEFVSYRIQDAHKDRKQ